MFIQKKMCWNMVSEFFLFIHEKKKKLEFSLLKNSAIFIELDLFICLAFLWDEFGWNQNQASFNTPYRITSRVNFYFLHRTFLTLKFEKRFLQIDYSSSFAFQNKFFVLFCFTNKKFEFIKKKITSLCC